LKQKSSLAARSKQTWIFSYPSDNAVEAEAQGNTMKQESGQPAPPIEPLKPSSEGPQYLSTRGLLIVFAALGMALVLGYLFVNKLVDISQEEDCALAHRYNCGAVEVPR
jgi:hypothetical protein